MRGIPIPFDQVPKTTARLGEVERARGPQFRGGAPGFAESAGNAALANARGFIVAEQSVGRIGETVAKEGSAMLELKIRENEARGIYMQNLARQEMELEQESIAADLRKEPDERKWKDIAEKRIQDVGSRIEKQGLSPDALQAVRNDLELWGGKMRRITNLNASNRAFDKVGETSMARITKMVDDGDLTGADRELNSLEAAGYVHADKAAEMRVDMRQRVETNQKKARAEQFNVAQNLAIARTSALGEEEAMRDLKEGKYGELDPSDKERIKGAIQQAARNDFADTQASILDGIATGAIRNEVGIDAVAPKTLRPADREFLKRKLRQDLTEDAKLEAAKPDVVRERFGRLLDATERFDAKALGGTSSEEARKAYAYISLETALLPESLRNDITGPLEKKWRGTSELDTTIKGYIRESLDDLYDNGGFGVTTRDVQVMKPDGITKAWEKQADVEGQKKARALYADAMIALNQWAKENPNATREDATAAIYGLSGQSMRVDEAARILSGANAATSPQYQLDAGYHLRRVTSKSTGVGVLPSGFSAPDAGLFPSIANSLGSGFTGGKITSYGYADDPTPDSNSAAGIGAWVPPAEQEKIKRGEASDFKLKPGDLAVSPDVEDAFQRANIRPGDTVTLTYADGTTHTGRWMDRTAREYKGKALKGRFDLYSPTGKHARDGQPVISFTRS